MALNFGGGGLFTRPGLYDDTGLLSERWGQEGSTVVGINDAIADNGGAGQTEVFYTVTSGKKLLVSQIIVSHAQSWDVSLMVRDSGTDKQNLIEALLLIGTQQIYNFGVPLVFLTNFEIRENGGTAGSSAFTITGWEEDA